MYSMPQNERILLLVIESRAIVAPRCLKIKEFYLYFIQSQAYIVLGWKTSTFSYSILGFKSKEMTQNERIHHLVIGSQTLTAY